VEEGDKGLEVFLPDAAEMVTRKSHRQLAASVLAIHEVAMREKTGDRRRRVFVELLLKLLARW